MKTQHKVWVIEDEKSSQFVYEEILGIRYNLKIFGNLKEFESASKNDDKPDALIADLRLPDGDFLNFLVEKDHRDGISYPFFVVSSLDDLDALRKCFEAGAQDYITKPFGKNEIVVKLERLFSGNPSTVSQYFIKDGYKVDLKSMVVKKGDMQSETLTAKEYQILMMFLENKDRRITRSDIMDQIWKGEGITAESKTIDVHISRLRKKISAIGLEIRNVGDNTFMLCDWMNNN